MKLVLRLVAGGATTILAGVTLLPLLIFTVVSGHLQYASQLAAGWDIPPELVPVFSEAGQAAGVPWFLLAAVASVATDFGRHGPDGRSRGDGPGTSIFPAIVPPMVGPGGEAGMFGVDPALAGPALDPQDDRAAADWLAQTLAGLAATGPTTLSDQARRALAEPEPARFWAGILAGARLRIAVVAPSGVADNPPLPPTIDGNPVRQFGAALLATIGAPVTAAGLDAIDAWAAGEGSCARFNPLDTTQPEPGATPFNTLSGGGHVWNYPSFDQGVQATSSTLSNGLYRPVLAALRADAGLAAVERAVRQSPWGTGPFGSPSYAGRKCGPTFLAPAAPGLAGAPPPGPLVPGANGIFDTIVVRAAHYQAIWEAGAAPSQVTGTATYVLPIDPAWFQAHPDWLQRPHHDFPAIDIPVPEGTPVLAVTAGQVVAADEAGGATSCGHDVRIQGRDGVMYTYCHGRAVVVAVGQPVGAGQLIMQSGWSGAVVPTGPSGAHLHFQIDVAGLAGPRCPQPALAAWAAGQGYDPRQLPSTGCVSGHLA